MSIDLFVSLFSKFSRWTYSEYHASYIERLPFRFMQGAVGANAEIQSYPGYSELLQVLSSAGGSTWRNPELYPHLNRLLIPNYPLVQRSLDALAVHLGLRTLASTLETFSQFWRLRQNSDTVLEIAAGEVRHIEGITLRLPLPENFPLIYCPYPHLFDDIEKQLYRGEGFPRDDADSLLQLTHDAFDLLARYSPDIASGFANNIGTIAYMPNRPGWAKSFTKRNFYIGGVFISICDPITVAEQFIHEYYHQVIWPWWMIEPPSDLPGDDQSIVSPVTGRSKSIQVMIHALLIYYSLRDFYHFVLSPPRSGDWSAAQLKAAETRLARIERGINPLVAELECILREHPHTLALVGAIASLGCDLTMQRGKQDQLQWSHR